MISSKFNCGVIAGTFDCKENFFRKLFKCKFCGTLFEKGCSLGTIKNFSLKKCHLFLILGGHISRVHKEESHLKSTEKLVKKIEKTKIKKLR